jgi:uncharacterized membrane protein HdeD (DUF308 family)
MRALLLLHGATAMACAAVALFFFRFWSRTHDRLFFLFGIAFLILGINRVAVAVDVSSEDLPYLYALRLGAFALIAFAIVDKNRSRR